MSLSVGIGLTNDCNLACAHCYRSVERIDALSLEQIRALCAHLPIRSVGLGTGENALHPQFREIVAYLHERSIRLSIASNGYSLNILSDNELRAFADVEVSIDFPDEAAQDRFRGAGNWRDVHVAMDRCRRLGIEVSILTTMMIGNYDQMDHLAGLAQARGVNLRMNVYQPVRHDRFMLSYEAFWEGFRRLFGASRLLSCTEPVVRAALGIGAAESPCGQESVRVTPEGQVAPCVYWPASPLTLDDLYALGPAIVETPTFRRARQVPAVAAACACRGGCASRRALLDQLEAHDLYCPWVRGESVGLDYTWAPQKDLVRARNYCTTIVM